jgi:DeoR/GlpR family transcriptional regulator of sugar metabolism
VKNKLYPEERYRHILSALDRDGRISVEDMSQTFGISQVTIRNDLQYLASQNLLLRTHGGAIPNKQVERDLSFSTRLHLHSPEKDRIGAAAASLVRDGDVIALDASTTALAIVSHLIHHRDLTIITNGLATANTLLTVPGITVFILAGFLRHDALSLVGHADQTVLNRFDIKYAFLSSKGLSQQAGMTELNEQEGSMKCELIKYSDKVIAVLDSSKIGHSSLVSFATIEEIDLVITDSGIDLHEQEALQNAGVEIRVV